MKQYILIAEIHKTAGEEVEIRNTVITTSRIKNITEYKLLPSLTCDVLDERMKKIIDDLNIDVSQTSCITLINDKEIYVIGSPLDIFNQMYS